MLGEEPESGFEVGHFFVFGDPGCSRPFCFVRRHGVAHAFDVIEEDVRLAILVRLSLHTRSEVLDDWFRVTPIDRHPPIDQGSNSLAIGVAGECQERHWTGDARTVTARRGREITRVDRIARMGSRLFHGW